MKYLNTDLLKNKNVQYPLIIAGVLLVLILIIMSASKKTEEEVAAPVEVEEAVESSA